jgi:hypothetical protein
MTEIRSYRRVFDLERRIYSVDRLRLNPAGVPVRGVVYFLAILAASLLAGALPLLGGLVSGLPWYIHDLALPGALATVLSVIRVEGRAFHLAAYALVRHWLGPRRLIGTRACPAFGARWRPRELLMLPDGSDARPRRMRYTGPGAVLVAVEHERRGRALEQGGRGVARPGRRLALELVVAASARPLERAAVISLGPGARLQVDPSERTYA